MRRRRGFTLIEMIITIAIAPVLFGAVFAISGFAAQSNRLSATNQDIQFRAQAILENIKARGETAFLTADPNNPPDPANPPRPEIMGFNDITVRDTTAPGYVPGLTVYQQTAEIMGQEFVIRVEDRAGGTEKISKEISPKNSSLLLPDLGAAEFDLVFHSEPKTWCEYNGERFYPHPKTEADGTEKDHFYLIVHGRESGGTALSQKINVTTPDGDPFLLPVVLNVIYPKDAKDGDAGSLILTPALETMSPPGFTDAVVPAAERVNFPETLDWAAASRKLDGDLVGWLQTEEHGVTLTFTDTSAAPRQWSRYETGYGTEE